MLDAAKTGESLHNFPDSRDQTAGMKPTWLRNILMQNAIEFGAEEAEKLSQKGGRGEVSDERSCQTDFVPFPRPRDPHLIFRRGRIQ